MADAEQGLNGLPAWKQGLVNIPEKIGRDAATRRMRRLGNKSSPYRATGNPNEFDILNDEVLMAEVQPVGFEFPEETDLSRPDVLTTLAGLELPAGKSTKEGQSLSPARVMSRVCFAGIAQDSVAYRPENPHLYAPDENVAGQLRGVFHGTAVGQDYAFGHLLQALPPPCEDGSRPGTAQDGEPNVGKARLILQPEAGGQAFGHVMQDWLADHAFGDNAVPQNPLDMTPSDLAFEEFAESLTDTILTSAISLFPFLVANMGARPTEADVDNLSKMWGLDARANGSMLTSQQQTLRRQMMQLTMANMVGRNPEVSANFTDDVNSVFNQVRLHHIMKTLGSLLDAVRIHNQWVLGRVIRPAKEKKKYYAILDH
jgi:hypothetical protein